MTPTELIAAAREDLRLWDAIGKPRALELIAALEAMQAENKPQWRKRISAAIFDPGTTEGYKGDRSVTQWQTDAVMRVIFDAPQAPEAAQGADHE
jgi:hypothetical protein